MAKPRPLPEYLAEVGKLALGLPPSARELLDGMRAYEESADCGDNSCLYAKNKGGMRTNGGCRCHDRSGFAMYGRRGGLLAARVEKMLALLSDEPQLLLDNGMVRAEKVLRLLNGEE
jgi:hypothetical protein